MTASWQATNRGALGAAATATQAYPAQTAAGQAIRLLHLQASIQGVSAGTDRLVVRDGASGAGTIIWSLDLTITANNFASFRAEVDLRATVGNALTIEFVNGLAGATETVNGQGDMTTAIGT